MQSILKKHTILYVEDEPAIQAQIAEYLENHFAKVHLASNGDEALLSYGQNHPDVLLLDINLPGIDGLSLAKEIRKKDNTVKIVMLTAHTEKEKLLKATELKLTKYLVKPVAPKAFKAMLATLAQELMQNPANYVRLNENYIWDKGKLVLSINGEAVPLSQKEHSLLKLFIQNKGQPVSYERIMAIVWEDAYDIEISIDSVKSQVSHLRKKLPENSIASVYGTGYMLK